MFSYPVHQFMASHYLILSPTIQLDQSGEQVNLHRHKSQSFTAMVPSLKREKASQRGKNRISEKWIRDLAHASEDLGREGKIKA